MTHKGYIRKNISMDEQTCECLQIIQQLRLESGVYNPRSCSISKIIREGIQILYLHEVEKMNIIHPTNNQ